MWLITFRYKLSLHEYHSMTSVWRLTFSLQPLWLTSSLSRDSSDNFPPVPGSSSSLWSWSNPEVCCLKFQRVEKVNAAQLIVVSCLMAHLMPLGTVVFDIGWIENRQKHRWVLMKAVVSSSVEELVTSCICIYWFHDQSGRSCCNLQVIDLQRRTKSLRSVQQTVIFLHRHKHKIVVNMQVCLGYYVIAFFLVFE